MSDAFHRVVGGELSAQKRVVGLHHVNPNLAKNWNVDEDACAGFSVLIPIKHGRVAGSFGNDSIGLLAIVADVLLPEVCVVRSGAVGSGLDRDGVGLHRKVRNECIRQDRPGNGSTRSVVDDAGLLRLLVSRLRGFDGDEKVGC